MEHTAVINLIVAGCASVCLMTVIFSCTLCLRYLTSVASGSEPVTEAKRAAQRKAKQTEQLTTKPPAITVVTIEPETNFDPVTLDGAMTLGQDVGCFSDAYSDVTTSPADSPFTSPLSTPGMRHKTLSRLNSEGVISHHLPTGKVIEPRSPSVRHPRRSKSCENQADMILIPAGGPGSQRLRRGLGLSRSLSVPDFREYVRPDMTFNITYDNRKYGLVISNLQITNLGLTVGNVGVKIHLCPGDRTVRTDKVPAPAVGPVTFDGDLDFDDLNESDLQRLSLLVTLTHFSSRSGKKLSTLGEVLIKVSELGVQVGSEVEVTRTLNHRRRSKKKSTSSNCLVRELGDIFILLQYQSHANRLKVLVRKAARLPSGGKLPGQPDHFVVVALRYGTETLTTRDTRTQKGTHPVWNEPFLFDVSGRDVTAVSLEFTLRRGRIYTKDNVLGHVLVGYGAPSSGEAHWRDAICPTGAEVARWHPILPVFQY